MQDFVMIINLDNAVSRTMARRLRAENIYCRVMEASVTAEEALRLCRLFGCQAAVLKERSPSCGSGEIYDGSFSRALIPGDGVTAALLRSIPGQVAHQQRSGAHDGHIAPEDVPQFRQLVQGCGPEQLAEPGQPDLVGEQISLFIPGIAHGPEFIEPENPLISAGPLLAEDHRAA